MKPRHALFLFTLLTVQLPWTDNVSASDQAMINYEIVHVAEPSARLARCGRMDFAEHLIDVYVDLFASPQGMPSEILRERIFRLSYTQYDQFERAGWPDPRTASMECAAHVRLALERIARWNMR